MKFMKMYLSGTSNLNRRGMPLGRWKDKVGQYICKRGIARGGFEQAKGEVWVGRGGSCSVVAVP